MVHIISKAEYEEQWQANAQYLDPDDNADVTKICPEDFGKGYERVIQLRGIEILIIN